MKVHQRLTWRGMAYTDTYIDIIKWYIAFDISRIQGKRCIQYCIQCNYLRCVEHMEHDFLTLSGSLLDLCQSPRMLRQKEYVRFRFSKALHPVLSYSIQQRKSQGFSLQISKNIIPRPLATSNPTRAYGWVSRKLSRKTTNFFSNFIPAGLHCCLWRNVWNIPDFYRKNKGWHIYEHTSRPGM